MKQYDYIVKTDGYHGYKIFTDAESAMIFCEEQSNPARVFEVITKEIYSNADR